MHASGWPDHVGTLIVGGGIVGCTTALSLVRRGYKDILVLDRASISEPLGSTGHAPGLLAQLAASVDLSRLAQISISSYRSLPSSPFSQVGSLEVARNEATLQRFRRKAAIGETLGVATRIIGRDALSELCPGLDISELIGGSFVPGDGVLNSRQVLNDVANAVQEAGVPILEDTEVLGFRIVDGAVTGVETSRGLIRCARVLVCVGIWGADLLTQAGVQLSLFPVQHPYVYTGPIAREGVAPGSPFPLVRDLDNATYYRQHGDAFGYGWYNHPPLLARTHEMLGAELAYRYETFDAALRLDLFPFLKSAPIARRLNGVFSMTPDGYPLLGRPSGVENLWVAEAVWITHAAGVGEVMADMMLDGRTTTVEMAHFDVNRFAGLDPLEGARRSLRAYSNIYAWPDSVSATTGEPLPTA